MSDEQVDLGFGSKAKLDFLKLVKKEKKLACFLLEVPKKLTSSKQQKT